MLENGAKYEGEWYEYLKLIVLGFQTPILEREEAFKFG